MHVVEGLGGITGKWIYLRGVGPRNNHRIRFVLYGVCPDTVPIIVFFVSSASGRRGASSNGGASDIYFLSGGPPKTVADAEGLGVAGTDGPLGECWGGGSPKGGKSGVRSPLRGGLHAGNLY